MFGGLFKKKRVLVEQQLPRPVVPLPKQTTDSILAREISAKLAERRQERRCLEMKAVNVSRESDVIPPTDPQGRPFVAISESDIKTETLITIAYASYIQCINQYPQGIWLRRDLYAGYLLSSWDNVSFKTKEGQKFKETPVFCGSAEMTCAVLIYGPTAEEIATGEATTLCNIESI